MAAIKAGATRAVRGGGCRACKARCQGRGYTTNRRQHRGQPGRRFSREGPWRKWWHTVLEEHRNDTGGPTGEEMGSSKKLWAEHYSEKHFKITKAFPDGQLLRSAEKQQLPLKPQLSRIQALLFSSLPPAQSLSLPSSCLPGRMQPHQLSHLLVPLSSLLTSFLHSCPGIFLGRTGLSSTCRMRGSEALPFVHRCGAEEEKTTDDPEIKFYPFITGSTLCKAFVLIAENLLSCP